MYDDDDDGIATEQPVDEADLRKKLNGLSIVLGKRLDSLPPRVPAPRSVPLATPTVEPPGGAGLSLGDQPAAGRPSLLNAARRQPTRPDLMPSRSDFPTRPIPAWQKVLGVAAAPFLPNLTTNILGRPQREAEQQYQRAYQEYKRPLDIAAERATTAKTEAEAGEASARAKALGEPKPLDETKQPIGEAGATQHAQQLETLTGSMMPQQKQQFLAAYSAIATDTHAVATKRLEDANRAAGLSDSERNRAVQLQIEQKRLQSQEANRAEARAQRQTETGSEIVRAVDKAGKVHLLARGEYQARQGEFQPNPMKVNQGALDKATDHATAINEMQGRANALVNAGNNMNWADKGQLKIVKQALNNVNHSYADQVIGIPVTQFLAQNLKQLGLEGATPETRRYIVSLLSLREAALALPKEITGGSRVTDPAVNALWQTLPEGATPNREWFNDQLHAFQSTVDRLKESRVPTVPGLPDVQKDPSLYQHHYTGKNGDIYSDDGKNWVDANGNPIGKK